MNEEPFREYMIDKLLDEEANDEPLAPAQRERARQMLGKIRAVWEKRAVMQRCPALCLMEIARATAEGNVWTVERACRYTNRGFWNNETFCREAVRINPEDTLEWVSEKVLKNGNIPVQQVLK